MKINYHKLNSCANCKHPHTPEHWLDWPEFFCEKGCRGEYEKLYANWAMASDNGENTLPHHKKLSRWMDEHKVEANFICDEYIKQDYE